MGKAADRKVKEIEGARVRLEGDLRELERRMPVVLQTGKRVAAGIAGSTIAAGILRMVLKRRKKQHKENERTAEVVIRVVREDQPAS
jgi:hypothetical protein